MSDWFEVVADRWIDARGNCEAIIYCGPLQACEEYAAVHDSDDLIIRRITF